MNKGLKIVLVLFAILLIWKNRSISEFFNTHLVSPTQAPQRRQVATVLSKTGSVRMSPMLVENTQADIGKDSALRVQFIDGTEIEFLSDTQVVFDFWNRMMPTSPALVWILSGDFKLIKEGSKDQVFMVHAGQIFTPSTKPQKASPPLLIAVETEQPETVKPLPLKKEFKTHSLSNDYMDDMISAQRERLIHCQQNALKNEGQAMGLIVIGFRIANDGKVIEPRVIGSTDLNMALQNCILEVISEIKFNSFEGAEIARSFEMNFE